MNNLPTSMAHHWLPILLICTVPHCWHVDSISKKLSPNAYQNKLHQHVPMHVKFTKLWSFLQDKCNFWEILTPWHPSYKKILATLFCFQWFYPLHKCTLSFSLIFFYNVQWCPIFIYESYGQLYMSKSRI